MPSSRIRRLTTIAVTAVAVLASASDAFAIRNRYTGQQNDGFGAYFFGGYGYGRPYAYDEPYGPAYRPYRFHGPFRPYRYRGPVYGYDE